VLLSRARAIRLSHDTQTRTHLCPRAAARGCWNGGSLLRPDISRTRRRHARSWRGSGLARVESLVRTSTRTLRRCPVILGRRHSRVPPRRANSPAAPSQRKMDLLQAEGPRISSMQNRPVQRAPRVAAARRGLSIAWRRSGAKSWTRGAHRHDIDFPEGGMRVR